jgi:hypothetical protein
MSWTRFAATCVVFSVPVALTAREGCESAEALVSLEVYDQGQLRSEEVREASQTLGQILAKASVCVNWAYCNVSAMEPCTGDVRCPTVILHIISQPRRGTRHMTRSSIGMTRIGRVTHATVFTDRTHAVAQQFGLPHGLLLGYTIAHEVGHLLLDQAGHSASGVMRAQWSRGDYEAMLRRWLTFAPAELRRIRRILTVQSSGCRINQEPPLPAENPGTALTER